MVIRWGNACDATMLSRLVHADDRSVQEQHPGVSTPKPQTARRAVGQAQLACFGRAVTTALRFEYHYDHHSLWLVRRPGWPTPQPSATTRRFTR